MRERLRTIPVFSALNEQIQKNQLWKSQDLLRCALQRVLLSNEPTQIAHKKVYTDEQDVDRTMWGYWEGPVMRLFLQQSPIQDENYSSVSNELSQTDQMGYLIDLHALSGNAQVAVWTFENPIILFPSHVFGWYNNDGLVSRSLPTLKDQITVTHPKQIMSILHLATETIL